MADKFKPTDSDKLGWCRGVMAECSKVLCGEGCTNETGTRVSMYLNVAVFVASDTSEYDSYEAWLDALAGHLSVAQ
jgi:hypothetical protein